VDLHVLLALLLGWAALSCLVVVPVCLLLRGAAVLEERARRAGEDRPTPPVTPTSPWRARPARRSVWWCLHTPEGTVCRVRRVQVDGPVTGRRRDRRR
jgi:hypothetical protein